MALSPQKFDRIYSNLTPSAKKVWECTPVDEPWPVYKVIDALVTRGINMRKEVVHGCLSAMTQEGLLKEPSKSIYVRVPVKVPDEEHEPEPVGKPFNPAMAESLQKAMKPEPEPVVVAPAPQPDVVPSQDFTPKPKEEALESQIGFLQLRVRNAMKELDAVLKELDTVKVQAKKYQTDSSLLAKLRQRLGL